MNEEKTLSQRIGEELKKQGFKSVEIKEPDPDSIVEMPEMRRSGSRIYWENVKMPYSEYKKIMKQRSEEYHAWCVDYLEKLRKFEEESRKHVIRFGNYVLERT